MRVVPATTALVDHGSRVQAIVSRYPEQVKTLQHVDPVTRDLAQDPVLAKEGADHELREAADAMRLSARGYHRVLRVARTLADLDGADKVGRVHLAEALSYRAWTDEVRRAA